MLADNLGWLKTARKKWFHNDSYWDFKYKLKNEADYMLSIQKKVCTAEYAFSPARQVKKSNYEKTVVWDAKDSLVLKYLAENIKSRNNFSKYCVSNKGNGGIPKAIKTVNKLIKTHRYIYRSDIKSFYNSINHQILLDKLSSYTKLNEYKLIAKHLDRIEWQDGEYVEIKKGISKSSPLSPVLGCIYLDELDIAMEKLDVKYLRYADDWIILAKTKHKLRTAVKKCKQILSKLELKEHPDKTDYRNYNCKAQLDDPHHPEHPSRHPELDPGSHKYQQTSEIPDQVRNDNYVGLVSKQTFNFLGIEFNHKGVKDIKKKETKRNFFIKISKLYEQIQVLMNIKNKISNETSLGQKIIDYINTLELLVIKKLICSKLGFDRYSRMIFFTLSS